MRTATIAITLFIFLFLCGCVYDPWRNESYQCEDSHWIAPHNYKMAFANRKKYSNVLLGNLVIKPFLVTSGGYYDGHSPYRVWFQVFTGDNREFELEILSVVCKKSRSQEPIIISGLSVPIVIKNGYASHMFQTAIPLDFKNKESATIIFSFKVKDSLTIEKRFEFKPILQKGIFKSLN